MNKKRFFVSFMIILFISLLSACAKSDNGAVALKDKAVLSDIVNKINEEIGISVPINVNDTTLAEVFHISKSDILDYSGTFSISSKSADTFIILKVHPDAKETVKENLEERRNDLVEKFKDTLPAEYEKAKAAKILEKGDYLIFICLGNSEDKDYVKANKSAQKIVESYFE